MEGCSNEHLGWIEPVPFRLDPSEVPDAKRQRHTPPGTEDGAAGSSNVKEDPVRPVGTSRIGPSGSLRSLALELAAAKGRRDQLKHLWKVKPRE